MWIREEELRNFRCHRSLTLQLQRGFVGIFGSNGAGKSTAINAIYGALTNDFSRFDGVVADMVREGTSAKAKSFIRVSAEHDDTAFELVRSFQPAGYQLKISGHKTLTKTELILKELEEFLGAGRVVLANYVFINQWDIFGFLKLQPAVRARTFQHLCGTVLAEECWKALGSQIATLQIDHPAVEDNSDELSAQLAACRKELKVIRGQRQALVIRLLLKAQSAQLRQQLKEAQGLRNLKESVPFHADQAKQAEANLTKTQNELKRGQDLAEQIHKGLNDLAPQYQQAIKAINGWKELASYQKVHTVRQLELADLRATLTDLHHPIRPADLGEENMPHAQKAAAEAQLTKARSALATLGRSGLVECPTCGTPVASLQSKIKAYQQDVKTLPKMIADYAVLLSRIADFNQQEQVYERRVSQLRGQLEQAEKGLKALVAVETPTLSEVKATETVELYEQLEQDDQSQSHKLAAVKTLIGTLKVTRDNAVRRSEELATLILRSPAVAIDVKAVEAKLAAHSTALAESKAYRLIIDEKKRQIASHKEALALLSARVAKRRKAGQLISHLESMREVVQANALPRIVAQTNLEGMEDIFNRVLEQFNSPFSVTAREDLSLNVQFPGESPRRAESLSGGQLVILALAYHRAVCEVFASRIGCQSLDEPTVGLDEQNIDFLHDSLRSYTAEAGNRGMQVLMISHSARLRSAFQQVIDLTPEGVTDEA